jgi:unsaturated rhamnogalacturonyl hydrolase
MKRTILTTLLNCLLVFSYAQGVGAKRTEETVRNIADNIIANTSFRFKNVKTGETYTSTKNLPLSADVKAESIYNSWMYANGVLHIGMLELGNTLSDKRYTDYVKRNYEFLFDNMGYFERLFKEKGQGEWYNKVLFKMNSLDACGALSAGLLDHNAISSRKDYLAYLDKVANYVSNNQMRLTDKTFSRPEPREMTVWGDDLYMSVPFLARMGKATGNNKYFDDAITQVKNFNRYLFDPMTGLYFHAYFNDLQKNGVARWGRCNGWIALAQVELLNHLPEKHPARKELTNILLRQIIGFSRFQDPSGLWHQVLDKPDSYLESSVSCMFIYAVAKAVNQGWIDKSYMSIAENGWNGLSKKITASGEIADVCIGTGIENDIAFYYNRPKELNEFHVAGAALMAGSEMIKFTRNGVKK